MTDATAEEAKAVITRLREESKRLTGRDIGSIRRYIASFDTEDLDPHLKAARAQRSSQSRAGASEGARADRTCQKHFVPLDCPVCAALPIEMAERLLTEYGADRRPDLARRLAQEPAPA